MVNAVSMGGKIKASLAQKWIRWRAHVVRSNWRLKSGGIVEIAAGLVSVGVDFFACITTSCLAIGTSVICCEVEVDI